MVGPMSNYASPPQLVGRTQKGTGTGVLGRSQSPFASAARITVRHTGYADRELRFRKLDRDARTLHEELAERPGDHEPLERLNGRGARRDPRPRM
jgi:hypothetical protein